MTILQTLPAPLVVALGAVPGAWVRFGLVRLGLSRGHPDHWATWGVNMLACFLMGLLVGWGPRWDAATKQSLELAFAVGFLGSMSTFSTLLAQLLRLQRRPRQAIALAGASLLGGLLACSLGLAVARTSG
ncbi:MAG: CrcB family protein [Cyanobacteriota bacterium]|nr:CrcB family protein [Cyanobacteriota bacterium]